MSIVNNKLLRQWHGCNLPCGLLLTMSCALLPTQAAAVNERASSTAGTQHHNQHTLPGHPHSATGLPLKLSTAPLDESRIGKVSAEERNVLLMRQKLLLENDPVTSILGLQNQIRQLQDGNEKLHAQLVQAQTPSPIAAPPSAVIASQPVAAMADQTHVESAIEPVSADQSASMQSPEQSAAAPGMATTQANWKNWLRPIAWLGLTLPAVIWGVRRYTRRQPVKATDSMPPPQLKVSPTRTIGATLSPYQSIGSASGVYPAHQETGARTSRIPILQPTLSADEEAAAIIEEANLYAIHNHPLRAVKLLQELLAEQPKKIEAWILLFAILSSLEQAEAFEKHAHNFLRHNGDVQQAWKIIQMLGRTLDANHGLYRRNNLDMTNSTQDKHQLIGEILVELDMVMPETLKHCLETYNSKKHGRLGAYLVSQKVILHTQLTEALLYQQEPAAAASAPSEATPADAQTQGSLPLESPG